MTSEKISSRRRASSPFNRTAQHDAKRAAILSQAAKLFNYKGSRSTTLRDIADELGLTKTSLYYYVKTKEDLIYQCYRVALQHYHTVLDQIERDHDSPVARTRAFFLQHFLSWQAAQEGRAPHIAALLEIATLRGTQRQEIEQEYIAMFTRLRHYLRDGVTRGDIRVREPTSATRAILGSLEWAFSWLHSTPLDRVDDIAQQAWEILERGIAAADNPNSRVDSGSMGKETSAPGGFNREQQNLLKQEAFYKTGTRFFNRQGFAGTSLDEIAQQLDVSKGAFYYYIKNKEDLLYQCYVRSLDIVERIHAQAAESAGAGLQKAESTCLRTFLVQNSSDGPLIRYNTITALPTIRRRSILKRTDKANARFGQFLTEGIADKSVRPVNTFVAQQLIAGARNAAMDLNLWRRIDNVEEAAVDYFDVLLKGLLPH
ncbi:MAG: TetR/AcrR family transcriptional regulator [Halioglobus sp.]|nr:TetR/AcrR family transcriptional regulator [Halioglobus sp.]